MTMSKKIWIFLIVAIIFSIAFFVFPEFFSTSVAYKQGEQTINTIKTELIKKIVPIVPPLNKELYDQKLLELANNPPPKQPTTKIVNVKNKDGTITESTVVVPPPPEKPNIWPVKTEYPKDGALLPFNRIIAYYGNLYSTKMGVLGEYPETEMLAKLAVEVKKWETADPNTPVIPALHYIAVVAQASAGGDGKYRTRMPFTEIDKVLTIAEKINAIVFLDIQVGFSTVEAEVPLLEKYLKMPNVHLGIDPEFSMKTGIRPGKVVGTLDATDINFATEYLAKLVKDNNLTPKILIIHRYTQKMVTNYQNITTPPEVQFIMHMDGWGGQAKKIGTYTHFIYPEPVQFTGFKLFYKNDILTAGTTLMTPETLLKLNPRPIYIQYQ
jgi:hypothetical protein